MAIFSVAQIAKLLQSPRKRARWEQERHNKLETVSIAEPLQNRISINEEERRRDKTPAHTIINVQSLMSRVGES